MFISVHDDRRADVSISSELLALKTLSTAMATKQTIGLSSVAKQFLDATYTATLMHRSKTQLNIFMKKNKS